MRKGLFVLLSLVLVVALAVPAAAEMKVTGFYRVKPTVTNFVGKTSGTAGNLQFVNPGDLTKANTESTTSFTEMRNRIRFEFGDENVKGVTFFELDGNFGDMGGKTGRNQGFAQNGDSINLETKNAYLWFRIPNTELTFQVGLQGYTDEYAGLLFGASDQAGVVVGYKFEPVTLRLAWLALRDDVSQTGGGPFNNAWIGTPAGGKAADYYAIDAKFSATKELVATLNFSFINDRGLNGSTFATRPAEANVAGYDTLRSYYIGANATAKLAPVTLTAFFLYNFGKFEGPTVADVDIGGYAGSVRADLQLGPGNAFLEGLYVSGDADPSVGSKFKGIITGNAWANLTSYYWRPDLWILLPNIDMQNSATALVLDGNNNGRGLILGAAGFSMNLAEKIKGKVGLGYLAADKKRATTNDKGMGTEINANVNYNISKGLDFGLYGAYAFLGDFYNTTLGGGNPDDPYLLFGRLNYAF